MNRHLVYIYKYRVMFKIFLFVGNITKTIVFNSVINEKHIPFDYNIILKIYILSTFELIKKCSRAFLPARPLPIDGLGD